MKKEKRVCKVNIRESGEKRKLTGVPIVYGKESDDIGFIEIIERGAAKEALEKSDIRALYGHNSDSLLPLGRTSAGTLRTTETKDGLEIEIDPPDTQFARDLSLAIERGDIQDMSFSFTVKDDKWETKDGRDYRTITKIEELFDVSFVSYPAYPDTSVAVRSLDKYKKTLQRQDMKDTQRRADKLKADSLKIKTRGEK